VVGDIPSLREVWGDAAVYVPPGMPAALRHALIELIQSPSHCRDLGEAARAHALQYTDSLMARRYRSLYDHLLHHHLQEQQLVRYPQQVKAETIRL
jgi:glycosyltransferase involved in cell wall biosynthesis